MGDTEYMELKRHNQVLAEHLDQLAAVVRETRELLNADFTSATTRSEVAAFYKKRENLLKRLAKATSFIRQQEPLIEQLEKHSELRRQYLEQEQHLLQETDRLVRLAFTQGMDYRQVSEHVGLTRENVWRRERRWKKEGSPGEYDPNLTVREVITALEGLKSRRKQHEKEYEPVNTKMIELVRRAYNAGISQQRIAEATGIKRSTLRVWLGIEEEWNLHRKKATQKRNQKEVEE